MKRCPRCNEMLPLLSKVCPVCGAVVESEDSLTAEDMANSLEYILHDIKEIPVPGFVAGMSRLSVFIVPIISIFLLIIAWISSAGLFWILFVLSLIWSVWVIVKKFKGTFKADMAERDFKKLKNDYEMTARIAKRDFGENKEVKKLLAEISTQISDVEESWNREIRKNVFIWIAILAVIIILSTTGTCSVSSIVKENTVSEVVDKSDWKENVKAYLSASEQEQDNPEYRLTIVNEIITAGQTAEAEKFFLDNLMGKIGDMECAKVIVMAYVNNGDKDNAKTFVKKCTAMRYKSDIQKLENLLK